MRYFSATPVGNRLPSPAEIFHGGNLVSKKATAVDMNAVRTVLKQRHAK